MPINFSIICDLLEGLEGLKIKDPPLLPADLALRTQTTIRQWFRQHRRLIDAPDTDGVGLLSTLFPERRTDRVYGLQHNRLASLVARCLQFNVARNTALALYKVPGNGDLGACLERVLREFDCEPKPGNPVTVEEVDRALQQIASRVAFSSPAVRSTPSSSEPVALLGSILIRLRSAEAKWLVRLVLKNFSPVILDEHFVLYNYHFLLPGLLRFQDNFGAAVNLLRTSLKRYHANPDPQSQRVFKLEAAKVLTPRIGIKVGRPPFFKARSIAHCLQMALPRGSGWSIERKYDGEYCEIHIDLSKGDNCIQIFSKSGRDSTADRRKAHKTIRDSLRIGRSNCIFKKQCIVVAELVVYNDQEKRIQEFHKIRKYVDRSGRRIGTELDSPRNPHEHLMLIYFDVLMIDDDMTIGKPYDERRDDLRRLIRKRPGYAMTSEHVLLDISINIAIHNLRGQLAAAIANRAEGLVLKPANLPYFSLDSGGDAGNTGTVFIKLKQDYMQELGTSRDVADLVVIGTSYDPSEAQRTGIAGLRATTIFLGCVLNATAVRFGEKPIFRIVGTIGVEQCIPKSELQGLNDHMRFCEKSFKRARGELQRCEDFDLLLIFNDALSMTNVLAEPCVVEVLGSGFEKPGGRDFFALRHPRILKLHLDRSWKDATTFDEYQDMATKARNAPDVGESQEAAQLIKKLISKHEAKIAREASLQAVSTIRTASTDSTRSPLSAKAICMSDTISPCPIRRPGGKAAPITVRVDVEERVLSTMAQLQSPPGVLQTRKGGSNSSSIATQTSTGKSTSSVVSVIACNTTRADGTISSKRTITAVSDAQTMMTKKVKHTDRSHKDEPPPKSTPTSKLLAMADLTFSSPGTDVDHATPTTDSRLQPGKCHNKHADDLMPCPFTDAVIFLSPCVSRQPWLTENLLRLHGAATVIENWFDFVRESTTLDADVDDTVAESQAYPGQVRIVLTESGRIEQVKTHVRNMQLAGVTDILWWFDWRVAEDLFHNEKEKRLVLDNGGQVGASGKDEKLSSMLVNRFIGISSFDVDADSWVWDRDIDGEGLVKALFH